MRTSWINTFAVAAILASAGLLYGQGAKSDQGPPKSDKEAPPKTKIDEMVTQNVDETTVFSRSIEI